jgi:hypothetical protein
MSIETGDLKFQLVQAALEAVTAGKNATNIATAQVNEGDMAGASAAAGVARQIADTTKSLTSALTDLEGRYPET